MTHFAQRNLRQTITYWGVLNNPTTNEFGHPTMEAPITIAGRWEDKVQQIRLNNGEEVTSSAEVLVDRDLEVGGYIALGDQTAAGSVPIEDAREIQAFSITPDLRNLGSERRAYL